MEKELKLIEEYLETELMDCEKINSALFELLKRLRERERRKRRFLGLTLIAAEAMRRMVEGDEVVETLYEHLGDHSATAKLLRILPTFLKIILSPFNPPHTLCDGELEFRKFLKKEIGKELTKLLNWANFDAEEVKT